MVQKRAHESVMFTPVTPTLRFHSDLIQLELLRYNPPKRGDYNIGVETTPTPAYDWSSEYENGAAKMSVLRSSAEGRICLRKVRRRFGLDDSLG